MVFFFFSGIIANETTLAPVTTTSLNDTPPVVITVVNMGPVAYRINDLPNPPVALVRGVTYIFAVNASGHPFWIKSMQSTGQSNAYMTIGLQGNGASEGNITFSVPMDAPDTLYYNCEFHPSMTGVINITSGRLVALVILCDWEHVI